MITTIGSNRSRATPALTAGSRCPTTGSTTTPSSAMPSWYTPPAPQDDDDLEATRWIEPGRLQRGKQHPFEDVPDLCPHCGERPIYVEVNYRDQGGETVV